MLDEPAGSGNTANSHRPFLDSSNMLSILVLLSTLLLLSSSLPPALSQSNRHSFQPPFGRTIIDWNAGAGAFVNTSFVRLTPAKQSRTGYLWNTQPVSMSDWQAVVEFSVSGLRNLGGDGFAFWYTEKSEMLGAVYGSTDFWTGLGVFFDTFNNDNIGSNPLISAIYNDGTQRYDYASDGSSQALDTCSFDFRNTAQPAAVRVRYEQKRLTVEMSVVRDSAGEYNWKPCIKVDNLELGVDKYFGLTAHTGDVADNHDVHSFVLTDLTPANADIAGIRQHYQQTLTEQHSQPSHQDLSVTDFQHTVLTMLSQMQEEINLIQMTELHVSDWIYTQEERMGTIGIAGVRPGGSEPAKPLGLGGGSSVDLTPLVQSAEDSSQKLNSISDTQANLLREVRSLQTVINGLGRPGAPLLPPVNGGGGGGDVAQQVKATTDSVQALQKRMDEQVQQLKTDLGRIQSSINNVQGGSVSSGGGGSEGGMGWIAYLMLSFTTFCVASLTYHTFTQHMKNQRYKMI